MSTTIDEKVVEMRFDNKQFEAGVQTSLSTLEKLKKGLDLDGAAKSFDSLSNAAKKCDVSMLSRSVETVSAKFSALETIAVGALLKIGNQAVTAGEQLLKSMTVDQVTAGWEKYAEKTTAVQTIMAATGKSIDEVNGSLEKLIWFTDETSYSMTDMTSNIGKFTSQGVDLDTAVTAMQGISTWAALSGGSINEASRAMYNLSQALGVGAVKLMDWKSIENANMATKEFKEMAMEAAVATGDLTKSFDAAGNAIYETSKGTEVTVANFSSTLQDAWFTSDALIAVLNNYGGYADGVYELYSNLGDGVEKTTSEIIQDLKNLRGAEDQTILDAGYTEDQIELVRRLSEEVGGVGQKSFAAAQEAKTFSEVLGSVKEAVSSGWAQTFETIFGNYEEAKILWTDLANALYEVFAEGGNVRNELLSDALSVSGFDRFTDVVKESGIELNTFQEKLEEVSDAKGISLSRVIAEYGSLEEAVQNGAISTDLLKEAALACAEGLDDIDVSGLQDALDEVVDGIDELSGRQHLISAFWNTWEGVGTLLSTVKDAFREIFPATTADQIYNFARGLNELSESFKTFLTESEEGQKLLTDLTNTFKGIFAAIDIVKQAFSALWRALAPEGSTIGNLLSSMLGITGSFGEWLVNLDETIKKNDTFYKGLKTVIDLIKGAITTVKEFAAAIGEKLNLPDFAEAKENVKAFLSELKGKISASSGLELFSNILENLCTRAKLVKDAISGMKDSIVESLGKIDGAVAGNKFVQVLNGIWTVVRQVASAISGLLGSALEGLIHALSNADFNSILDFLNILATGGAIAALKKFLDPMNEMKDTFGGFVDWVKGLGGGVSKILDGVRGSLEAWQTKLKSDALGKIAASIAVLAVSLLAMSAIDSEKLSASLGAMTALFVELTASMAVLDKLDIDGKAVNKTATAMVKMGAALLLLSTAVKSLSELDPAGLAEGLIGVGVLLAEIAAFLKVADFEKGAAKAATGMVIFAAAIKILASAVNSLGGMDWGDMAQGLVGVGVLLAEIDVFLNTAKFSGKAVLTATGIVILSSAIKVLASACKDFGEMSWGQITKGLASVGALLLEITAFTKLSGDAKHVISTGLALIEIAAAMKIFASAMDSFSGLSWEQIATGLVAMGGALAEITVAINFMPKNMVGLGLGLIEVGAALEIIANAFGKMGDMGWGEIAKGLVALGGALAELAIALNLMNGTLKGSASLMVAAGALAVLTPVLLVLGTMSWESIAKGLITIAGAFTVMGVAAAVLSPLTASILALSAALTLIGVGAVAIGGGLVLIGAGLTSISVGLTAFATAVGANAAVIIAGFTSIILGVAGLIPAIAEKIGEAIVAFCGVISDGAPAIGAAVKAVILTLVDVLVECVPAIADGALQLVTGVLAALVTYTPQIIDSVMQFLIEILEGIARNLPQLIQAAMDVIGAFFSGLISALGGIDVSNLIDGIAAIGLLTGLIAALSVVAGMIPSAMVGVVGLGALVAELAIVLAAIGALAQIPGLEWLISEGGHFLETVGTAIGSFVGGIVGGFMSGVSSSFPKIGEDLSAFMTNVQPFIDGASSITPNTFTGVKALTETILLLTAADILQGLTSWLTGGSSLSSFAEELVPFGEAIMEFSKKVEGLSSEDVTSAAMAGKTLAEMAAILPNSGGVIGFFTRNNDMDAFGKQLVSFGGYLKEFAKKVDGLGSESVTNAATAGKAVAELANSLPNSGGVLGFFAGNNDIDTFGKRLIPFGEAISKFANSVNGLKSSVVTNAATAGKALVELANTVPNCGGVIGFFVGNNNLDTFGAQLVVFGNSIKDFSDAVTGVKSSVVTNSATAGKALVELANTIPNCGGLISFFTGDNRMSDFGKDIVVFGKALAEYSDAVRDVRPEIVTASVNAATALSSLAEGLPDVGLLSRWFGNQALSAFGADIADFGGYLGTFYSKISSIDSGKLESAVAQIQSLVGMANSMKDIDSNAFSKFGSALKELANTNITDFTNVFYSSSGSVSDAVQSMLDSVSSTISRNKTIGDSGMKNIISSLAAVITNNTSSVTSAMTSLMNALNAAIRNNGSAAAAAMESMLSGAISGINSKRAAFEEAGRNAAQGFINGLQSMMGAVAEAGASLGGAALNSAKEELDSHSPSREFIHLGENVGEGMAIGIDNSVVNAVDATSYMIGEVLAVASTGIKAFEEWLDEKKYYNEISLKDELAGWEHLQQMYAVGSEERKKIDREVYRVQNELVAATYQNSIDWIEEEKYYNRLSLEQELAAYEQVQSRYLEGSDQRKSADREVYRVKQELADEAYQSVIDWIEEEKYYNRLSTQEELAIYEQMQTRYVAGSEERKKIDREVYRLRNALVDESYEHSMNWIEKEKYYNRLSLEEELAAYERVQARYAEGTEEWEKMEREKYRVRNEIVDASYQHSMNWIEEEKYYNRLSLEQELAAYERVQARYEEGSEEWKKMEREKYRVRNEIVNASYENSMNWIEEEKYYNRMSLADELAAYKRVQSRYGIGTAERKKMDREVYRLEKEIYESQQQYLSDIAAVEEQTAQKRLDLEQEYADKVKSINEQLTRDIESENNRYMSALESRTSALYGSYGLFDEVKEKEEVSSDTLMRNLEDQVKEFSEWQDTLDSLSARGVDSELIAELSQMGPSSIAQIKALESMTSTELNKYVSLWQIKHGQARAQAVTELEDLRMETLDNIEQLRANAAVELEEYREIWLDKLEQVNADAEAELAKLQNEFSEKVGYIKKDTEAEMQEMADTAQSILRDAGWDEAGQEIVNGLEEGIEEEKPSFINTLIQLASAGIQAFKDLLGINSPSKVFRDLGNFTGLGFVEGLVEYADRSYEAGSTVAENAKEGLSEAMLTISDYLNSDMDVQPTIRPVLDLSNVTYGIDTIDGLFQNQRLLALAGQTSFAFSTSAGENDLNITVDNDSVVQELRSLRSEMAEMTERMAQMQIVLDSGAMVGQMVGPMDEALGQRAAYRRRGN